jgi:PAS domain-containing protein
MALNRLDGVFTAANPALQRMLGRAEEEIVGHNVLAACRTLVEG